MATKSGRRGPALRAGDNDDGDDDEKDCGDDAAGEDRIVRGVAGAVEAPEL